MVEPDSSRLTVSISDGRGRPVGDARLARWLSRVAPPAARGDVTIALVSDARMRALNRRYRGRDHATDVLSFPNRHQVPEDPIGQRGIPAPAARIPASDHHLGDIVIATGVARRQARQLGHRYQAELRVLALHGLLHLLGYDHEHPEDRGRMARAEGRLRRKGRLISGLIERGAPVARASLRPALVVPGERRAGGRTERRDANARARAGTAPRQR